MAAHPPPADDVHAVPERREEAPDLLGRVLEIGVEGDDDVTARPLHPGEHRRVLPVVPVEPDDAHRPVLGVEGAQDVRGAVAAAVVHEDDLVRPPELLERLGEAMVEVAEALGLVEDRHDDRERRARLGPHRGTSRTRRQSL